jgi:hypothetical protein
MPTTATTAPAKLSGNTTDTTRPDYRRPESADALEDLALMDDLLAGTRKMHQRAKHYIYQWQAEAPKVYEVRSTCETLYGGFERVLQASAGMMFRSPPTITYASEEDETTVAPHWDNLDAAGTAGPVWAHGFALNSVQDGVGLILVDHPPAPAGVTLADEQRLNLRPTWAMYRRANILSWQTETLDNADTPTLITLAEPTTVANGFGVEMRQRVRVLRLVEGVATWELVDVTDTEPFVVDSGVFRDRRGQPFRRLPIAVAQTGGNLAPFVSRPPLLPVAYANLAHYQISTDLRFYRMVAAYPQPVVSGNLAVDPVTNVTTALNLGPLVAVRLQEGGSFTWAEISGSSLETLVSGVREKLEAMAQLGLAFLIGDKRGQETAEARRLDGAAEQASLASAARAINDALNLAMQWHAQYLGIPADRAPVITLAGMDAAVAMTPQEMTAVASLVQAGMPAIDAVTMLQAGGRLAADRDPIEMAMEWAMNAVVDAEVPVNE